LAQVEILLDKDVAPLPTVACVRDAGNIILDRDVLSCQLNWKYRNLLPIFWGYQLILFGSYINPQPWVLAQHKLTEI